MEKIPSKLVTAFPDNGNGFTTSSTIGTKFPDFLKTLSTAEFAAALGEKAASLRSELCRTGSVKGIIPIKMPGKSGRLRWAISDVQALFITHKGGK